ncbi:MAG: M20/M25/M40 family metallo-hydrolase [Chloroherpetonaceae bacterium]|nr:M20/M25/M40 family metallo-hydrolase [Chloroherpetonaceae bacterium]
MMRFLLKSLVLLIFVSSLTVLAQEKEYVDTAIVNRIKDEALKRSQVMDIASSLTDVYGPRLTGSPQLMRANEWTKKKFEEWGLQNARLEAWGPFGFGWTLERYALGATILGEKNLRLASFPVISYPKAWSAEPKAKKGEVVLLEIKSEEDFAKYKGKLKGKFIMVSDFRAPKLNDKPIAKRHDNESLLPLSNSTTQTLQSFKIPPTSPEELKQRQLTYLRTKFLFEEEPAAILDLTYRGTAGSVSISGATMPPPAMDTPWQSRPKVYEQPKGVLTQISLNPEHYGRIFRALKKGMKVEMEIDMKVSFNESKECFNTIAEIPGTDPKLKDEVVMLGAHIDSWHTGTGATDNGAGTATMMEAVRVLQEVFKSTGVKPKRTIRIGLWSGEEQGLFGSFYHVKKNFGDLPDYLLWDDEGKGKDTILVKEAYHRFAGYFNLDNGGGHIRGIYLQQNDACRNIFRAWLEPFAEWNSTTVASSNTGGTDHLSFDAIGLPGFQFIQDPMEYGTFTHHSNMDTYERLVAEDMMRNAAIVASFVYHTAMRSEKLPRKPVKSVIATGGSK